MLTGIRRKDLEHTLPNAELVGGTKTRMQVGWPIYTQDGERLGEVKEIRGRYFKVRAKMEPDFWLETETVVSTASGPLTTSFCKHDMDDVIELRLIRTVP